MRLRANNAIPYIILFGKVMITKEFTTAVISAAYNAATAASLLASVIPFAPLRRSCHRC